MIGWNAFSLNRDAFDRAHFSANCGRSRTRGVARRAGQIRRGRHARAINRPMQPGQQPERRSPFTPVSPDLVPRTLFTRRKYWAERFGLAQVLPTTRAEMDELGWDSCDVILVTGDAYVDHPSFGMALVGRLLEAQGFRVGIIAQPDWRGVGPFAALGRPNVLWGVTAGNMDSMVNRYTSDRRLRHDDSYSPDGAGTPSE